MTWLVFFVISWGMALLLVRPHRVIKLWPAGLVAVIVTLLIDSTLIKMGAFLFHNQFIGIGGVPLFYALANFANGMTLVHLVPSQGTLQPVITLSLVLLFLMAEFTAISFGYFTHLNWNLWYSLVLNTFGFATVLWVTRLFMPQQTTMA
jgi:hypothetical protein